MEKIKHYLSFLANVDLFRVVALVIYTLYYIAGLDSMILIPRMLLLAWGALLLAYEFFFVRSYQSSKYWKVLLIFTISYGITVLLNYKYDFINGLVNVFYLAQTFLLFYPNTAGQTEEDKFKWLKWFNRSFIAINTVVSFLSIVQYIFKMSYWLVVSENYVLRQGFMEGRLFGLYTNPNSGAIFSLCSMFMILQLNIVERKDIRKFSNWGVFAFISSFIYLILAVSRGTIITGVALMLCLAFFYIFYKTKQSKKRWKNFGRSFSLSLLSLFLVFCLYGGTEKVMSYCPSVVEVGQLLVQHSFSPKEGTKAHPQLSTSPSFEPVTIQHSEEGSEISSGRVSLWKAGIEAWKQKPLFGLGNSHIYRNTKPNETTDQINMQKLSSLDRQELKRMGGYLHNTYVVVLVKAGIIGLALYLLFQICFFLFHLVRAFKLKFDWKNPYHQLYLLTFCMLLALIVDELVENHLVLNNRDVIAAIFWVNAGLVNYLTDRKKIE